MCLETAVGLEVKWNEARPTATDEDRKEIVNRR